MKNLQLSLLILFQTILILECQGQFWNTNGNAVVAADFIGTTNALPFKIYSGGNTPAFERIRVLDNNGFVGIGTTTPAFLLDVNGGDINVNTIANGYRINSNYVMRHEAGFTSSLSLGVSAGSLSGLGNNIYAGYFTGAGAPSGSSI